MCTDGLKNRICCALLNRRTDVQRKGKQTNVDRLVGSQTNNQGEKYDCAKVFVLPFKL